MGGFPGDGFTGSGPDSSGSPGAGSSADGSTVHGKAGNIEVPTKKKQLSKKHSTTTPHHDTAAGHNRAACPYVTLHWAKSIEPHRSVVVASFVRSKLDMQTAQQIVDELAGSLESSAMGKRSEIKSIQGWVREVVRRSQAGGFVPELGPSVARRRAQAMADQSAHAAAGHQSYTSKEKGRELSKTLLQTRDSTGRLHPGEKL